MPLFEVKGDIPPAVVHFLEKKYGQDVEVFHDNEETVNIIDTAWYKNTRSATTPGDALKIYRQNAGITQEELGRKLGKFSRQKISDMERGKRTISKEVAKKLSLIFDVSIDRFL